jgi:hypothetical protein
MAWSWHLIGGSDPPGPFPTFVDVGAPLHNPDPTDGTTLYVYWVGSDGTLWRRESGPISEGWQQVPVPPGTVTRVAVYPNGTVACVTKEPAAVYVLPNGNINATWSQRAASADQPNDQPFDVCAARDGSIWVVMSRGQQWISHTARRTFNFEEPTLIAVAGFTMPVSETDAGGAWGIFGDPKSNESGSIAFCNGAWELKPNPTENYIGDVVDISTSPNYLWMVKADGTVWTTQDGMSEVRMGETFLAQRISGGYISESDTLTHLGEVTFAVGKDGLPYTWHNG